MAATMKSAARASNAFAAHKGTRVAPIVRATTFGRAAGRWVHRGLLGGVGEGSLDWGRRSRMRSQGLQMLQEAAGGQWAMRVLLW